MVTRLLAAFLAAFLSFGSSLSLAAPPSGRQHVTTSTIDDQQSVSLTIYNVNLGLVKDLRTLKLPKGIGELRFMDVASQIIPASVHIRSLSNPASLSILEQNYEYDLLNAHKLLDKYVGKEVKLYTKNPYTEREEVVTATLLSNNGGPIFRINDEITYGHPGRIIFPGVPENLMAKPTLVWLAENNLLNGQKVEASYLTNGINWRSDYVVTLNENDDHADLAGWVTIDIKSGTTYRNAKLKLVAGDVNRVKDEDENQRGMLRVAEMAAKAPAPQFKEESFFEYHIYTLQRPATVKDNQTKKPTPPTCVSVSKPGPLPPRSCRCAPRFPTPRACIAPPNWNAPRGSRVSAPEGHGGCGVPRRGPDRPVRQHQQHGHRPL